MMFRIFLLILIFNTGKVFAQSKVDTITYQTSFAKEVILYKNYKFKKLKSFEAKLYDTNDQQIIQLYLESNRLETASALTSVGGGFMIGFSTYALINDKVSNDIRIYSVLGTGIVSTIISAILTTKRRKKTQNTVRMYNHYILANTPKNK